MKDEEMAEEYICNGKCQDDITKNYTHCKTCTRIKDFLAGLKAGRPQWHDLRKDPNNLPEDKEYVLVYTNLTNYYVAEKVENHFMSKGWGFIPMSTVIAWCEIPTFDKE